MISNDLLLSKNINRLIDEVYKSFNKKSFSREEYCLILHKTKQPEYLSALSLDNRYKWADTVVDIIKHINYNLKDLFEYTAKKHSSKIYLISSEEGTKLTYTKAKKKIDRIAANILKNYGDNSKVCIFSENSIDSALVDLACLIHSILVVPLNIHFSEESLNYIFKIVPFSVVVTDTIKRLEILLEVRTKLNLNFDIVYTDNENQYKESYISNFSNFVTKISDEDSYSLLNNHPVFDNEETSTIMFTSGSTGLPKGVLFNNKNIITKRFCRGAALPEVGVDEVFLSYLPLFHTFGRYLELVGSIYWEGTYIFSGKNDVNSLVKKFTEYNPTFFVSIPLRWKELYDKIYELLAAKAINKTTAVKKITGANLKWGLSAAGYLDPKVFKFFNNNGVYLCSGFGMTEATGGISMTPPKEYVTNSVGIPLPGINIRFNELGELQISGPYVAKYLDNVSSDDVWVNTGDLFTQNEKGFLYIIDRIKDIYKNIKGETIAPAFIEKKFENVPGFRQVFLVGDMKPVNSLLIVPDLNDPFIKSAQKENKLNSYYDNIISNVNKLLKPFERILRYKIINRPFTVEQNELTAKGTYKRKIIEANFKKEITELYKQSSLRLSNGIVVINIPVWILKELGLSENELVYLNNRLVNKDNQKFLTFKLIDKPEIAGHIKLKDSLKYKYFIQAGDFIYQTNDLNLDLSVFIRQPYLWLGNRELMSFIDCKTNWDLIVNNISYQVYLNNKTFNTGSKKLNSYYEDINRGLKGLIKTTNQLLYGNVQEVKSAIKSLEILLINGEPDIVNIISRRMEMLAYHPVFDVRSTAYKTLILHQPAIDYNKYLPAFIHSGLTFINKKTIQEILFNNVEGFNLESLRKRLSAYRNGISYPVPENYAKNFKRIFELLEFFVNKNPQAYSEVRAEFVTWILHKDDKTISNYAREVFNKMARRYENRINITSFEKDISNWNKRLVFQSFISPAERNNIIKLFSTSTFLKESILILYNNEKFELRQVETAGIFITRISSDTRRSLYKVSINTVTQKHYEFVLFIKPKTGVQKVKDTFYLMIKIASNPEGSDILPSIGNFRSNLGVLSLSFVNDLTVWDKIRQIVQVKDSFDKAGFEKEIEVFFKKGMAAFFIFLIKSNFEIITGNISPYNVVVAKPFYKEGTKILSISGWQPFTDYKQIFYPLFLNFYYETVSTFIWSKEIVKVEWIFEACLEGLGYKRGLAVLNNFYEDIKNENSFEAEHLKSKVKFFLENKTYKVYYNSALISSIHKFNEYLDESINLPLSAKKESLINLYKLYRIDQYKDAIRYIFFYETWFKNHNEEVKQLFEGLLNSFVLLPDQPIKKKSEIKEIQDLLDDECSIDIFNLMVFPKFGYERSYSIIADENNEQNKEFVIRTKIKDKFNNQYFIRQPLNPFETGFLNKLFLIDNYPLSISNDQQYLILFDEEEEHILGGICYRIKRDNIAHIDALQLAKEYRDKNLGKKLIEDFFARLKSDGVKVVTTYFFLRKFFEKQGFVNEEKWGGLVKYLN